MHLLPRDEAFFALFVEQAGRIVDASSALAEAFRSPSPDWNATVPVLDKLENEGDMCARNTIERLAQSFITPFDPEDIHRFAIALNSILDCLNGLAERCRIYGLTDPPEPMRRLAGAIENSATACQSAVLALSVDKDAPEALEELRRLERDADQIYRKAMYELFQSETDVRKLMTGQRIYDGLETATDRFETVSYLIEEIRLKNA
jgi:uncharacterized protein Yka (UPF0111/DUF47 family)